MIINLLKLFIYMFIPSVVIAQHLTAKWEWEFLASIPDTMGYAGAYVGTVNNYLLVAGGANFPDGTAPWDGGKKVWTDRTFVLKEKEGKWIECSQLPQRMGYGATVSYEDKMYVAGGSDEQQHLDVLYEICWDDNAQDLKYRLLGKLPTPLANCASIRVGHYWYILGGIRTADAKMAESSCWKLDLRMPEGNWIPVADVPGKGRMLAVTADMDHQLLVFSGVALENGQREYLQDAYILESDGRWTSLPQVPTAVAAATGPAYYDPRLKSVFVFGGDDGRLAQSNLKHEHPGFSSRILQFDCIEREWSFYSDIAMSKNDKIWVPVTTGSVYWKGGVVLPTGEVRPGIRSPQVLMGNLILDK